MSQRPQRFGLQAWLAAAFVAMGAIASIAVMLVILPTLESSVRTAQAQQTGANLISELRERRVLSNTFTEELDALAAEIGGDVRMSYLEGEDTPQATYTSTANLYLRPEQRSPAGQYVYDRLGTTRYIGTTIRGRQVVQAAILGEYGPLPVVIEAAAPVLGAESQIALIRRRVLVAVALALIVATLAGIAIARVLGSRIRGLAGTARSLAAGDLAARARETAPQELAVLGGSLNTMAARLEGLVAETVSDRDRARTLVGSLAEGVLAVTDQGEVTVANASAQRLLGLPAGAETITLDELPAEVRDVIRRGISGDTGEATEVTLPGGLMALVNAAPLAHGSGVVLTVRDVTEDRRLARARRDLIANVSHELKTPLTAVKGFMELLEDDSLDPARRREFVALMTREVGRLERLVAEQLELARLDAGALSLHREPVDLNALADGVVTSRRHLAERAGVELVATASLAPVTVDVDAARIEQILLILLDNAIRHTPDGGKITVGVASAGTSGLLSVRDTGSGISPDSQQFVFDRFFQADRSREGSGLGLGLAIARGLAEAHGGSIEVRSTPQVGSVFTVRLPLASADLMAEPAAPTHTPV